MTGVGDALNVARRSKGLTQKDLADAAELTQAALSRYENGMREPSPEVLSRLAACLGVMPSLLDRPNRIGGAMAVDAHMRRRATANVGTWRRLEARLNMFRLHTHRLMEEVQLRADYSIPLLDPLEIDPASAARICRMQWRMPVGPVKSIVQWMEGAGCVVIEEDFGTSRVDGLSQWVDNHPVVLINSRSPTDRKRLTLAHELGHLVLHSEDFTESPEDDANQFAAEFLMPEEAIRSQLRGLNTGKLLDLKRLWMVSMQALIERAHNLDLIKPDQRQRLYKQLSAKGWRTVEPISNELPPEAPRLSFDIGEALQKQGLSESEIAQISGFGEASNENPFRPRQRHLRAI